jgi:molybdopterin adenylyltransferase
MPSSCATCCVGPQGRRQGRAADGQGQRHGRAYRDLFQLIKSALTGRRRPAGRGRRRAEDDDVEPLEPVRIGVVSISDRASSGVYEDKGIPALQDWLGRALRNPISLGDPADPRRAGHHQRRAARAGRHAGCHLVLTTGGTGPAPRDVTPEATLAVADKVMPGFGEQMRQISLNFVPTAILSRQVAVIRGQALIINLPGQPKSIAETLQGLPQATPPVHGIFAAVPYCIDLIGGPYLETDPALCQAFRPKSAQRPPRG